MEEIEQFFKDMDTWDIIIVVVVGLLLFKLVKRLFLLALFAVALIYFIHYFG